MQWRSKTRRTCLSSGSAGHWPEHNRTSLSILWDKLDPMTRGQLCSRPGPGLLQKAGLWPQRQNGHLLHWMRRRPNSKRVCPMDCLKLHIYCSTVFEISTFLLQVLCGHRYQTSQLPKCQSVHWGTSEEADSLTLPSPYWLRPQSSIATSWICLLMYHQFRSLASHSPIPRTGVYCPGTAPTGGWFHDLLQMQSWEEEEDGGVRPPVQPPQWTNQTSAAIAKNQKFHPATSSTLATGTARRP